MAALAGALVILAAGLGAQLVVRWTGAAFVRATSIAPERVSFTGGSPPDVHVWRRYHAHYYAMAHLFLAFDMEMVFMYPWVVVFVEEGMLALVEMLMFIAILLLGILYASREKALGCA